MSNGLPIVPIPSDVRSWVLLSGPRCGLMEDQSDSSFPRFMARTIIDRWSSPGDWILDPFCGWGTTADVAHEAGRFCLGIESDSARASEGAKHFRNPSLVILGDSRTSLVEQTVRCQLLITSPPFFLDEHDDHKATSQSAELVVESVLAQRHLLNDDATIAVEAILAKSTSGKTRAYNMSIHKALCRHFRYLGETVFCCASAGGLPGGFNHSYILEFSNHS